MEMKMRLPKLKRRVKKIFFKQPTRYVSADKPFRIPVKPINTRTYEIYHQPVADPTSQDLERHLALANELGLEPELPRQFTDRVRSRDARNALFGQLANPQ